MMLRALYILILMASAACGDDGNKSKADAAPPVDARLLFDANRQACSVDDNRCTALDYERVCDTSRSFCVECLRSSDCEAAGTLGPTCSDDDQTCRCASSEDCSGNVGGSYCHPIAAACGCLFKEDCPDNSECELEPYLGTGIRRCVAL